jgi:CDP-diacylglycerol---glycerol-3-phosphate 3-phosphatidyltransferase
VSVNSTPAEPTKRSFSEWIRFVFKDFLNHSAEFLDSIGVTPNLITVFGVLGAAVSAWLIWQGYLLIGAATAAAAAAMDAFDGSLARFQGITSPLGAFLDSTLDRYSEGILILGLGLYFLRNGQPNMIIWCTAAVLGSILVSYTRARGEAAGYTVRSGLFTRLERTIVFIVSLAAGLPEAGIILIAVFSNITAMQRIIEVFRQDKDQSQESV